MRSNWGRRAHGDFTDHCFYENGFCVHCDHFFLGLAAAYGVERIRSRKLQLVCDGILTLPLVLPPTVAGFFLLYIFGVKRPVGRFFWNFRNKDYIFMAGNSIGSSGDFVPFDVPFGKRSAAAGR